MMYTNMILNAALVVLSHLEVARAAPQAPAITSTTVGPPLSLTSATSLSTTAVPSTSSPSSSSSANISTSASPAPTATIAPFTPAGGLGTNNSIAPVYAPISDFDFQSMNLALNQEWIELDLFHNGLAKFSDAEFEEAGINAEDRFLIEWMADQEVDHAVMLSNILGPSAAKPCNYSYPYTTVREFIDFCQKLTRFGESGVYGFLEHLDSRPSATLLLQSITTEARQQMIFRQFEGLFPVATSFIPAITQSMAWTLLSPYIVSCPAENPRIVWQNFPALNITNNPSAIGSITGTSLGSSASTSVIKASVTSSGLATESSGVLTVTATSTANGTIATSFVDSSTFTSSASGNAASSSAALPSSSVSAEIDPPAITNNRTTPLSAPGREVHLVWEAPGIVTGYNGLYTTNTSAGAPQFVAWVSSLNTTYTPLLNVQLTADGKTSSGMTVQPDAGLVFPNGAAHAINGTLFIAITDADIHVSSFNFSAINEHIVAGPAIYQSG